MRNGTHPTLDQIRLLKAIGRDAPTIFDIGANTGQTYTEYRRGFPGSEIYCFEPFPDALKELRKTIGTDPRAHVVESAVAETPGERTFYVNGRNPTNSLLPRPSSGKRYYPRDASPRSETTVDCVTIDGFVAERGITDVDVLKLDIQGGEVMALRGADALLRSGTVAVVLAEALFVPVYDGAPLMKEVWSLLEDYGYTFYSMYQLHLAKDGQLTFGDALFVSEEVRSRVLDAEPEGD